MNALSSSSSVLLLAACSTAFTLLPSLGNAQTGTTGGSATSTTTGGAVTGGSATSTVTGGSATGGNATSGSVTGGNVTGGNATGGSATGGSATASGGSATAGSVTPGTVTQGKATASATVGDRQIIVTGAGSISVQPRGEQALVTINGSNVTIERERVTAGGKEVARIPSNAAKIEIDSTGDKLSLKVDGKRVPVTKAAQK